MSEKPESLFDKMQEKVRVKINTLEEYEALLGELEILNELTPEERMYAFNQFLEKCSSVWVLAPSDEKYASAKFSSYKMYGSPGLIDTQLTKGIEERGLRKEDVPLVPIIEYKLVPTGYVEYYRTDLSRNARALRRSKRNLRRGERQKAEYEKLKKLVATEKEENEKIRQRFLERQALEQQSLEK